jgi:malate dehydrogenase (oxaloacetate-decarboxylating)(NADP+)
MNNSGYKLLHNPRANKGTAFTSEERMRYNLNGLLPTAIEDIETQLLRVNEQVELLTKPINKYIYLLQLLDNNETLFFRTIMDNPAKYMPIIYTPTVGEACSKFGHILRRPRGMYISIENNTKEKIKAILNNWPQKDVRFTVVTDGERILGLGDQGISGMGIPIGKLCLYTACAGVPPQYTLPIVLDAGTNNESLLSDPLYLGLKVPRIKGKEYDDFIETFVQALFEVFPDICIQWEDFAGVNAINILKKYRERVCTFNDDIQGTASVVAAGLIAACRASGKKIEEHKFLFLGAGAASIGVAELLGKVLMQNGAVTENDVYNNIWLFDSKGLVCDTRDDLAGHKLKFAKKEKFITDFSEAIQTIRPTAIIGLSTIGGAFNSEVIRLMAEMNERPVIFPCSNPTSNSECTAEEAYQGTGGRVIFASGSPFGPLTVNGKTVHPVQGNNVYIFPAIGLAIFATKARRVTDEMFIAASYSLVSQLSEEQLNCGQVFPPLKQIRQVETKVAADVAAYIFDNGLARVERPGNIEDFVKSKMYVPDYVH